MFDIAVWTIIFLLSLLLVVYIVVIYWQKQAQEELRRLLADLRQLKADTARIRLLIEPYSESDPEPFGSLVGAIFKLLNQADLRLKELLADYGEIQSASHHLLTPTIQRLPHVPMDAYRLQSQINILLQKTSEMDQTAKSMENQAQDLEKQGWKVAGHARQLIEDNQAIQRLLAGLRAANIQDPQLYSATERAKSWEDRLRTQVPVYFISGDEITVQHQADKHTIGKVFSVVTEARPVTDQLLRQARGWEEHRLFLERSLAELVEGFRLLSDEIESLEAAQTHPIHWDQSRGPLSGLRQQIERLGSAKKVRTLEQLESDLSNVDVLSIRLKELSEHSRKIAEQHKALLTLLAAPDIAQGVEWGRSTQKLASQVKTYHPENFPSDHHVETLPDELQSLNAIHQNLTFESPVDPIQESDLPDILDQASELTRLHQSLRPRVSGIQTRLSEIQASERRTREALSKARALLNQAIPIASASPVLNGQPIQELESLRREIDPVYRELEQPATGAIDRKSQRADTLLRKADQIANRCLETLNADLEAKKVQLAQKAKSLLEIALLDDTAVVEAQRLLGEEPVLEVASNGHKEVGRSGTLSTPAAFLKGLVVVGTKEKEQISSRIVALAEAVPQLKQKNEEWQRCVAAIRALEDMEGPVLSSFQKAEQSRSSARQLLSRAAELLPEAHSWPPTSQALGGERGQLTSIERRWDILRQEPTRAINLVSKLGAFSEEYQGLANRVRGVVEKAEAEQNKIIDLEARFEESKSLWISLRDANSENAVTRAEITMLITEADQELESIRQKYKRGGMSYNSVLQSMRVLCQNLDNATVSWDDETVIDINGESLMRE